MSEMDEAIFNSKPALPNKLLNEDGTTTTLAGETVTDAVAEYGSKPALPNKFLNPDGSYSTLSEIISGMVDTDIFVIVNELPASGDPQKIYLVPDGQGGFTEYHYKNGSWDVIGTLTAEMPSQIYSWVRGDKSAASKAMWTEIYQVNKTSNVLVIYTRSNALCNAPLFIPAGKLAAEGHYTPRVEYVYFDYKHTATTTNDYAMLGEYWKLTLDENENVTNITSYNDGTTWFPFLLTDKDYSTPYTPLYDGSPATKKYVDDSIAASITDAIGGAY